jgi:hypothetical protein
MLAIMMTPFMIAFMIPSTSCARSFIFRWPLSSELDTRRDIENETHRHSYRGHAPLRMAHSCAILRHLHSAKWVLLYGSGSYSS